jgi:serine kinase of HPr protein (carbohydrate metabolism regulator)
VSTIHASAVLVGAKAALIRGPAGAGKSQLVWQLIQAAAQSAEFGAPRFARLVADDRAHVDACGGRLLVRPAEALAGMLEIRGLGIRRLPHEPVAVVGFTIDLATDAERYPAAEAEKTSIDGIILPRLAVAPGQQALAVVLAYLATPPHGQLTAAGHLG